MSARKLFKGKHRKLKIVLTAIVAVLLASCIGFFAYASDYYHADSLATRVAAKAQTDAHGRLYFKADPARLTLDPVSKARAESGVGVVFYPGGKVDPVAYAPLAQACADQGVSVIICPMPLNFAIFGINAVDGVIKDHPEISRWYLAGHSLGGAMAAVHAYDHPDELEGLILLAAYSTKDLSDTGLRVLSALGSNDGVLSRDKYADSAKNLPDKFTELVIEGGCHALFGAYGDQDGDGAAEISRSEQITQTVASIVTLVDGR